MSAVLVTLHIVLEEQGVRSSMTSSELEALENAVIATAYQESMFSEYKYIGSEVRVMRGDGGWGHGLMQLDGRSHRETIFAKDAGWDMLHNLYYGIQFYVDQWDRAKQLAKSGQARCIGTRLDWIKVSRSAYAMYNGGPAQTCRWTKTIGKWAENDQGFFDHLSESKVDARIQAHSWPADYSAARELVSDVKFAEVLGTTVP